MKLGLTFDDVLLVPQYSDIESRCHCDVKSRISKNIALNIPLVSSNMDTVTEDQMSIAMARAGGIGIIHRYCSIEEQVNMVQKVKRAESYIIYDPYTTLQTATISDIKKLIVKYNVKSFLVAKDDNKLVGILTSRDIKYASDDCLVSHCMTPLNKLIVGYNTKMDEAKNMMIKYKIQKLPIVDHFTIKGLICLKDIEKIEQRPLANVDLQGRLRCGAAIGVKEDCLDRASQLIEAGVDVLIIDIAHGDSKMCVDTLKKIKFLHPNIDVIAGNVATEQGALNLIKAGADGIKAGIGPGAACTTRLIAGSGGSSINSINGYIKNLSSI